MNHRDSLPGRMSTSTPLQLPAFLLAFLFLALLSQDVSAATKETPGLKLFSWWHAPKKYVIVFAARGPQGAVRWSWRCRLKPTEKSTRKTQYTTRRRGSFQTRRWGFNWRLSMVWVRSEYRGACQVEVSLHDKTWKQSLEVRPYSKRRERNLLDFLSIGVVQGRPRSVVALAKSIRGSGKATWSLRCAYYRKGNKTTPRLHKNQGRFSTGKWKFQSSWIPLGRKAGERGSCQVSLKTGNSARVWRTDESGKVLPDNVTTEDGCLILSVKKTLQRKQRFRTPSWKCFAVALRAGTTLSIRSSRGSWIRVEKKPGVTLKPSVSTATRMQFPIESSQLYRLRIHSKGDLTLTFQIKTSAPR